MSPIPTLSRDDWAAGAACALLLAILMLCPVLA